MSFRAQSVALEWAATASSKTVASTECTRNAEGSSVWQRTLITVVQRQGTVGSLDGRPQREVRRTYRAVGASFLLLPRRHALSS